MWLETRCFEWFARDFCEGFGWADLVEVGVVVCEGLVAEVLLGDFSVGFEVDGGGGVEALLVELLGLFVDEVV